MRRLPASVAACAVVALLFLSSACIGVAVRDRAPRYEPPLPETPGYVDVEGFEIVPAGTSSLVRLAVRYVNDTPLTFDDVIAWCRVFDEEGFQLGARRWELHSSDVGPMRPGFKTRRTLGVTVDSGARVADAACALKKAS